ncbi:MULTISPECIES: SDR family oxidoreductase [Streptomyces]|uniref:Oxidoreductase n=2 Tax=Streptomyces nigrescens TaxID=1920 RepID=A0A640TEU1_STRNI|nr:MULTISPECIES: SDR family oxidoreductase [Streptomyces]MCX5445208.1 SDR family oxidoreductase [Streptomyces libani]WAT96765.1 SDR family oxidoreductase [Streptomyces libani subsp. libani]WAU04675.1 SDR family oxidoreductase [Streptomyces nigrescens]WDT57489.1 SDR family oxidoreductase [Streptomyces sp. G7(2002)]GFE22167.1 oxidoreductase [Streptomyces libani subsp. libani]
MSALSGKTALVTGGSRGIGRAISERLAREGARVGVHYGRDGTAAKETVSAIEAGGGQAFAIQAELGVPGDAEALWAAFDEQAEGLDILVNNAGINKAADGTLKRIESVTAEDFDLLFAVNTKAPFFIAQQALPRLRDGGRIINTSTGLTRGAAKPELIAYAMTKGAIDVFTSTLAKDLGPRGITVNAVAPGAVNTDMNAAWLQGESNAEARQRVREISPLGRIADPTDIGDIVAFLASDDSRWVTGQWIDATGGALL